MLAPKRVRYRKQMKGRMKGAASRGNEVSFGDFGLQALECGLDHGETDRGRQGRAYEVCKKDRKGMDQGFP